MPFFFLVTAQRKQVPRKTRGTRLRIGCLILSCKVFLNELSPRQHLVETLWVGLDLHVRQILEKELDIISGRKVVCLCCFHNAVDHCAGFCAGRRVAEQPVLSADCKGVDLVLCTIVGDFVARILQIVFHIRALSLSVLHCLFQATGQWLCAELIQPTPKSPKHRLFDRKALFLPLFRRKPLYFFFSCKELVTKVPPDLCRYRRITFRRHSLHELSSQMRPTAAACDMRDLVISGIAIGMVATGILLNRLFGFRFIFLLCLVKQTKLLFCRFRLLTGWGKLLFAQQSEQLVHIPNLIREQPDCFLELCDQKSMRNNPELAQAAKNPVSRFWQKQHIKREYAKAARAAGQTAQGAASTAKTTAAAAKKAAEKSRQAASFAARHWKGALIVGGVGLMLLLVMGGLQSCTAMFGSTGTGLAATSYLSEDSDMLGAEAAYAALEADLQHELDNYESLHPGYDEYRFDLDEIKHDPYVLTSILSALHNGVFTLGEVQGDLAMLFEKQYILTQTIETETRYRTETRTDSEGNTYTVEVPYTYYICNVKLENFDLSHLPIYILTEEQMGFYAAYMQTLGNRPDLFPNGSYPHASTPKEPTYYEIPPEALKDEAFAAMIAEAEKYVGYPYVWGGSSPSTSFDCSGFISWVINHSGWNVGRQTAQGLYNICTPVSPEQAKPGDLVFFVGTYDTAGMSHVGLYVGNSVMLHCGDPISYTNLNSSYWQQHFYCYGRLP